MAAKIKNQESPQNDTRLLSSDERAICSQIAATDPPHSSRAQALLAIDEGETQAAAGRQVGLTNGQLRYWLRKFHKERIYIFPDELIHQAQQTQAASPPTAPKPAASPDKKDPAPAAEDQEAQQELPPAGITAAPIDDPADQQESKPMAKKKTKKDSKKKSKRSKKAKKVKKPKKKKKAKKGKKGSKKKKSKKVKRAKGKSAKKGKK